MLSIYFLLSDGDPVISWISPGENSTELKTPVKYWILLTTLFILAFFMDALSNLSLLIICNSISKSSSFVWILTLTEQKSLPY